MIEKFEDLGFTAEDKIEQVEQKVQEKLGVNISTMKEMLGNYTRDNASKLSSEFVNIVPLKDYSKLLETPEAMESFLKTEACKPEHWKLYYVQQHDVNKSLIQFIFCCEAVDDGDNFRGHVYVSKSGVIRHAFTQGDQ